MEPEKLEEYIKKEIDDWCVDDICKKIDLSNCSLLDKGGYVLYIHNNKVLKDCINPTDGSICTLQLGGRCEENCLIYISPDKEFRGTLCELDNRCPGCTIYKSQFGNKDELKQEIHSAYYLKLIPHEDIEKQSKHYNKKNINSIFDWVIPPTAFFGVVCDLDFGEYCRNCNVKGQPNE